jgi:hypothetical protein
MKTTLLNEKKQVQRIFSIQSGLIISLLLIVSPLITICYETFKLDSHIIEPSISFLVIMLILFYVKKGMIIQKNYGEFIPNIHKILHILSVGTMLVFCTIDLFGSGRILMSEITIVFIVCVPIEIYIIVSNRNRIMSHLNHQNYKNISLFFVATILITCITTMVLLLGIHSPTSLLISLTFFFTIPIFFTVLLGRELFI